MTTTGSINGFMPLNARKRRKGNAGDVVRYYDATLANPRTRLGPIEVFNERVGRVYGDPYGGGIAIQAGPMPHAGDRDQNTIPELYKAVSTALKQLRLEEFSGFGFFQVPSTTSRERTRESAAWVRRFD